MNTPSHHTPRDLRFDGGRHALILFHGLVGSPLEVQHVARRVSRDGYTVVAPHIPGFGFAPAGQRQQISPWQHWEREALAWFDRLDKEFDSVSVGGLCIGADLALRVAIRRPTRVAAQALLSTTLFFDGWNVPWTRRLLPLGYYTPLRHFISYRERAPYGLKNERLRNWIAEQMGSGDTSAAGASRVCLPGLHETERMIRAIKRDLAAVVAPTLLIHAVEDEQASPRSAEYVASHVRSAVVRQVLLHDSYHIITMDNEKERVAEEIIAFLDAQAAGNSDRRALAEAPA